MNLEDDILIARFLRDELSEKEKNSFLKRVENDKDFKDNYVFEKQLFESLNEEEWSFSNETDSEEINNYVALFEDEQTQKLKKVIQKTALDHKKRNKTKVITLITSIAAVIVVLITLNISGNTSIDNNQLYTANINLNELPSFATRGDENRSSLSKAENLFKEKKYQESLAIFNEAIKTYSDNSSVYIYNAVANTELKNYDEAVQVLDKLINSNLLDAEKGYWYKSLVYLKSNQLKEAKNTLKVIVENSYYKKVEAANLLSDL